MFQKAGSWAVATVPKVPAILTPSVINYGQMIQISFLKVSVSRGFSVH